MKHLKKKVEVYTDSYGVPHIFADNETDLFFVAGYIAARDRLFQLSMVSLAVRGSLSSVLGDKYLGTDIYLRTWRIHHTAKKLVQNMSPINRKIFEDFCNGKNYRIKEVADDLPIEFKDSLTFRITYCGISVLISPASSINRVFIPISFALQVK